MVVNPTDNCTNETPTNQYINTNCYWCKSNKCVYFLVKKDFVLINRKMKVQNNKIYKTCRMDKIPKSISLPPPPINNSINSTFNKIFSNLDIKMYSPNMMLDSNDLFRLNPLPSPFIKEFYHGFNKYFK